MGLLIVANVINLGADLGAMGAALELILPGPQWLYVGAFAVVIALLEVFMRYANYASVLRWLTLSLFAYVATVFVVGVPWRPWRLSILSSRIRMDDGLSHHRRRRLRHDDQPLSLLLAGLGGGRGGEGRPCRSSPFSKRRPKRRGSFSASELDTLVGMGASNLVALFIVLTTAATLNAHGVTNIETSADAAKALRPIAGDFAFAVFALGIVGTGLLAVPSWPGARPMRWPKRSAGASGSTKRPAGAPAFYWTIAGAIFVGALLNFSPLDPIKALFYSAVVNGVAAVPIMAMIMHMASQRGVMGEFALHPWLKTLGWIATAVMAAAAIGMFATWNS